MAKIRREYRTEDILKLIGQYGDANYSEGQAHYEKDVRKWRKMGDEYLRQLKELLSL